MFHIIILPLLPSLTTPSSSFVFHLWQFFFFFYVFTLSLQLAIQ